MNFQSLNLKTPLPDESRQQILNTGSSQRHIQPIIVFHRGQVCGLLCHSIEVIKGRSLTLSVSFTALKLDPRLLKRKERNPCWNANLQGVRSSSLPWVIWAGRQSHLFLTKTKDSSCLGAMRCQPQGQPKLQVSLHTWGRHPTVGSVICTNICSASGLISILAFLLDSYKESELYLFPSWSDLAIRLLFNREFC